MKGLIKIFFIFLAMIISLLSNPYSLQTQSIDLTGSIQNTPKETVILVSNNTLSTGIITNSKEENNSFSGVVPLILSYIVQDNYFYKNKTFDKIGFIHNLSTNRQKVHQIRAP